VCVVMLVLCRPVLHCALGTREREREERVEGEGTQSSNRALMPRCMFQPRVNHVRDLVDGRPHPENAPRPPPPLYSSLLHALTPPLQVPHAQTHIMERCLREEPDATFERAPSLFTP
jgi:hypothetical protein